METFDTNLVVRLLVEDDASQSALAMDRWQSALSSGGVYLPTLVITEAIWVLSRTYKHTRAEIADAVGAMISTIGVVVENRASVRRALADFVQGCADFSDYLVLEAARSASALPVITFDRRFARLDNVSLVDEPTNSQRQESSKR